MTQYSGTPPFVECEFFRAGSSWVLEGEMISIAKSGRPKRPRLRISAKRGFIDEEEVRLTTFRASIITFKRSVKDLAQACFLDMGQ